MTTSALPARPPGPALLDGRVERGFNVHHSSTVFVQRVDLAELADLRTGDAGPRFAGQFIDRFGPLGPEIVAELHDGEGLPFDRALLEAILAIERSAARAMGRLDLPELARIVPDANAPHEVDLVWECRSGTVARAAAKAALSGILELLPSSFAGFRARSKGRFAVVVRKLEKRCKRRRYSPSTAALVLAAKRRGLPCEPLAGDYLRLGDGALQQVVSASATTDLDVLFPPGAPARIPVALVVGARGAGAVARDLDGFLRASGRSIGLATRKLVTIEGKPVDPTSHGRGNGAPFLLGDPRMEMVVSAVSPRRIEDRGLKLDRTTATAILDGEAGRGVDVAIAATSGPVIVGADQLLAGRLIRELPPERVVLIGRGSSEPAVNDHLAAGGSAVVLTETGLETIEIRSSSETLAALRVSSLRPKSAQVSTRRIRRAMFAVGLAFGLGLGGTEIVTAVEKRRFLRR